MVDYSLQLCYGIIVPNEKMWELKEAMTDKEYDMVFDYWSRCINCWVGDDYFIGIMKNLDADEKTDLVYHVSEFTIPSDDDEKMISFKRFFDEHDLWKLIDWKPELMLINFCY